MSASSTIMSPFGTFSQLPKEIRVLIWKHLLPESRDQDSFQCSKPSLAILGTNHQLSTEVSTELYNGRILTFHLAPNPISALSDTYSYRPSTIDVFDHFRSKWSLYPRFHKASDEHVYPSVVWKDLPFYKLKSVRFEVEAPDPDDPAQLIQVWNKLCWLLDVLHPVGGFPHVEVHAIETCDRKWCNDGELRQTFTKRLPSTMGQDVTDLEILLSPFLRLRNTKSIKVMHPFKKQHEMLDEVVSDILRKAGSPIPFGLDFSDSDDMDDEMIMSSEDTWTVWFDYILDDLSGPSAPFVRLERFSNWSPQYTKNIWCLVHEKCEIGGALLSDIERYWMASALAGRVLAKLAFNPMSFKHVQEDESSRLWYTADEASPENAVLLSGKDGWWPGKWWEYQEGIPRKSSVDHQNHMDKYGNENILPVFGAGSEWLLQGTGRSMRPAARQ